MNLDYKVEAAPRGLENGLYFNFSIVADGIQISYPSIKSGELAASVVELFSAVGMLGADKVSETLRNMVEEYRKT